MVSFDAIVPEVKPEIVFPVPPIVISPTFTCVAESVPLIVAAVAVIPEEPQVLPVPSDRAEAFTVPVVIVFPETVV